MAGTGIRSVVDKKFIGNLTAAAQQAFGKQSGSSILAGQSSQVSLSSSLRFGAQAYAVGVANLNNTISFSNLAKSDLQKLGEITDKMVGLAKEATQRGVGDQGRKNLDIRFRSLVDEFSTIVDSSVIGENNYLDTEGLAQIFISVGLDKETSESIAAIFERFLTPEEDTFMASEYIKGKRPYQIPAKAYTTRPSDTAYQLTKISDSGVDPFAGISTVNSIYGDEDTILNQNPGVTSVFMRSANGTTTTLASGSTPTGSTLMAVNETTGYSVVVSVDNPLGYNPSGFPQLFIVDEVGNFVQQVTNAASDAGIFTSVDISADSLSVAYTEFDGTNFNASLVTFPSLGDDPSGYPPLVIASSATTLYSGAKIANSGSHVAFLENNAGVSNILFSDNGGTIDAALQAITNALPHSFGFLGDGRIAKIEPITPGKGTLEIYEYGIGITSTLNTFNYTGFATLEGGESGYIGYIEDGTVTLVTGANDVVTTYDLTTESVSAISLAYRAGAEDTDLGVDIGILGNLSGISGDSDLELYRYSFNTQSTTGRRSAVGSEEADRLFSTVTNLRTRPAAYRALNDLEALQKQIGENIEALDYAMGIIEKNVQLVRETGLALLDIAGAINSEDDAEDVARLLRDKIRKNAGAAMSQAENLEPITVAALTFSSGDR